MIKEFIVKVTDSILPDGIDLFEKYYAPEQELIRCKDCRYIDYVISYKKFQCPKNKRFVEENWFCADRKRRNSDA